MSLEDFGYSSYGGNGDPYPYHSYGGNSYEFNKMLKLKAKVGKLEEKIILLEKNFEFSEQDVGEASPEEIKQYFIEQKKYLTSEEEKR